MATWIQNSMTRALSWAIMLGVPRQVVVTNLSKVSNSPRNACMVGARRSVSILTYSPWGLQGRVMQPCPWCLFAQAESPVRAGAQAAEDVL